MERTPSTGSTPHGVSGTSGLNARAPLSFSADCVSAAGLDARLVEAADEEKWDGPIPRRHGSGLRIRGTKNPDADDRGSGHPPHGLKGPVMAPAPTAAVALRLWDAIQVLSQYESVFRDHPAAASDLPGAHVTG